MVYHINKRGLLDTFTAIDIKGVLPTKVTGTRRLPLLSRAIENLQWTFQPYEADLSTFSEKMEGKFMYYALRKEK